jgi:MFS family permease
VADAVDRTSLRRVPVSADDQRWSAREIAVVASSAWAVASTSLTQTLSVPLIPILSARNDDLAAVSWIATATLIMSAVSSPIVGRLGDMYGKRSIALMCLGVSIVAAFVGATVETLPALIAVRAVQGVAAGVIPLSLGTVRDGVHPRRLVAATSLVMAGGTAGGAGLGPIVSGAVLDAFGIGAGFALTGVAMGAAMVVVWFCSPPPTERSTARFDVPGAVGLCVILVTSMLALTRGPQWGWASFEVTGLFTVSVVTAVLWVRWERRVDEPAVDLATSSSGPVLVAHLCGVVAGFASFAQYIFVVAVVATPTASFYGLGESLLTAGLVQLPGVAMISVSLLVGSRAVARWGVDRVMAAGALGVAAGFALGAARHGSVVEIALSVVVVNAGLGPLFGAMPLLIMRNVTTGETAAVNAVNSLARQVGSVGASALSGTVMAASSIIVGTVSYPAEWSFVALYTIAAALAGALSISSVRAVRAL